MFLFRKKDITTKEDAVLLAEYRQSGDKALVGELFKRYAQVVLGSCAYYLEDKDNAKDAVMQIFDKLMDELKHREIDNFKGWLSFVVRNHCISEIRKRKTTQKKHEAFYEFEYQMPDEQYEEKISKVDDEEMLACMQQALAELKPQQKQCVELFYLQQKSYQQIAEQTSYSLNEVKSFIQNGKRNLKILIEEKQSKKIKKLFPAA
ncbi:MAG: sigma-70 family RNA polymerase sigma factor [Bacteroidia bacterium]|nr:sigma-70 family RNA polymerase sigma factor [Bacteroidia bacterium]